MMSTTMSSKAYARILKASGLPAMQTTSLPWWATMTHEAMEPWRDSDCDAQDDSTIKYWAHGIVGDDMRERIARKFIRLRNLDDDCDDSSIASSTSDSSPLEPWNDSDCDDEDRMAIKYWAHGIVGDDLRERIARKFTQLESQAKRGL